MEKTKKEKEEHGKAIRKLNEELTCCSDNLKKSKSRLKELNE
jgi:hypothetical protein